MFLLNMSITWGGRLLPRGSILVVLAPQDSQPALVAGPEHERQKMQPQLVMNTGGHGEQASSAIVTVNPEQVRPLVPGGSHHENSCIMQLFDLL